MFNKTQMLCLTINVQIDPRTLTNKQLIHSPRLPLSSTSETFIINALINQTACSLLRSCNVLRGVICYARIIPC